MINTQTIEEILVNGYTISQIKAAIARGFIRVIRKGYNNNPTLIDYNSYYFTHLSKPNQSKECQ
ncbi:hypothetical protein [Flavobacterium columnare]|uniref:hypothetical protein n=1 Tax=Flavobacterium columnare TaxID=996 RepID=UPI004033D431